MPVWNGLPYLADTMASILAQTFSDWEFIIVDNASDDGSAEYVESMARQEPRIRLLRNPTNLGMSGGLNRGLAVCRGHWVARIDADDIAMPNRLERQLAFVAGRPEVKVASCLAYYIDSSGKRVGKTDHDLVNREDFDRYVAAGEVIAILHPGALIDRRLLVEVGGYRQEFDPANDADLWGRISERGAVILVQQEYLMEYRVHGGSITTQSFVRSRLKHQWVRACIRARRSGGSEPTWEEFLINRKDFPWWQRLNSWRKLSAKRLYRQSGYHLISEHRLRAALEISIATFLQPTYTLRRLKGQILR